MKTQLNGKQRQLFAELANAILPGDGHQPSAVEIDIAEAPLDSTLRYRPDLEAGLLARLQHYRKAMPVDASEYLQALDEVELRNLMVIVCAAYYMHPTVMRVIGYSGQAAITLGRGGFGAEELVLEMMDQPKRFRTVE
jgi:hypothetical protein